MAENQSTPQPVRVQVVKSPDGRPGLLLQLPDGYLVFMKPAEVRTLAATLVEGADDLEAVLAVSG